MMLQPETTGFVRGGMLFLEPPDRWRAWQRDVWSCCRDASWIDEQGRLCRPGFACPRCGYRHPPDGTCV